MILETKKSTGWRMWQLQHLQNEMLKAVSLEITLPTSAEYCNQIGP